MSNYIVAIEIGSSKILGAVGKVDSDNCLTVEAVEEQPLTPGSVRYGCVVNVEEVSSKLNIVKRMLENSAKISPGKITGAYITVGGRSLASHPAESSRSFNQETEITETIVGELREQVRNDRTSGKEVLNTVPLVYIVDGKKVNIPAGTLGFQIKARYNLIVCDEKNKKNIKTAFDKIGLKIVGGIARILAIDSLILSKDQRGLGSVIIDFGAETTTVAVYKDNALKYLSTIPMGSRSITKDLATLLNISEERAEEIKMSHVDLSSSQDEEDDIPRVKTLDNLDYKLINNIVRARASEIIANVNNQISQSQLKHEDLTEGIIMIGRGSRLNGFRDLLQKSTKLKIAYPSSNEKIQFANGLSVPVADALDVIAILATASKQQPTAQCVEIQNSADVITKDEHVNRRMNEESTHSSKKSEETDDNGQSVSNKAMNFFEKIFGKANFDEDE